MNENLRPIIIKRVKKFAAGHHGGAWKVAYADFVTAMMAFFLLLWLLNAVTEEQRKGIADYFRPTLAPESVRTAAITIMEGQPAMLQEATDTAGTTAPSDDSENPDTPAGTKPDASEDGGTPRAPIDTKEAEKALAEKEEEAFKKAEQQIRQIIQTSPDLKGLSENILIDRTEEGLRIQLVDRDKISMFPSGSSAMNEKSQELLRSVAKVVAALPNKLAISGHTDAATFANEQKGYTNWELSTERANASRRVLVEAGIDSKRIETIRGKADTDPLIKNDPMSPQNRRISIVLLHERNGDTAP